MTMAEWLLDRLFDSGDQRPPRFAVQSTLNWMRALAILVEDRGFTADDLSSHFAVVQRRAPNFVADTGVFEHLLMAQHNVAALQTFSSEPKSPYNVVRSAIVAWYYAIYESASAMTLASSGANAEQHRGTARIWHAEIIAQGLAPGPFGLHLDTLVPSEVKAQVEELRQGSQFELVDSPQSYSDALGAACGYISGTAEYEQRRVEEQIRNTQEFKSLNKDNFRTKAARQIRDQKLSTGYVNFLVQAFRYRGKANYRDSIYLSYGPNYEKAIRQFLSDLATVGSVFLKMANGYACRRVERGSWESFLSDLEQNSRLDITPEFLRLPKSAHS